MSHYYNEPHTDQNKFEAIEERAWLLLRCKATCMKLVSPHGCHESSRHAGNTTNGLGDDYRYRIQPGASTAPTLTCGNRIRKDARIVDSLAGCVAGLVGLDNRGLASDGAVRG